jgi:hypothetical protein
MSTREFFAKRLASELPAFVKVARALPGDKLEYKPHEKNTPAGMLSWQLACELGQLVELFEKGDIHFSMGSCPGADDIVAAVEQNGQRAIEAAKAVSEDRWNSPAKFFMGDQMVWEDKVSDMAWGYLFDMVHHRGQLSAYIRPMGGKVPAIYGPSADEH